jgi:hypothetical protein
VKVYDLIKELQKLSPDAEVYFDTEAATFTVHCVRVDGVEELPEEAVGKDDRMVILHTKEYDVLRHLPSLAIEDLPLPCVKILDELIQNIKV